MAALDFPAAPAVNDTYSANGRTFTWNGESWLGQLNRPLTATTTLDFPAAPDVDDIHQQNGREWQWNGESWRSLGAGAVVAPWDEVGRATLTSGQLVLDDLLTSDLVALRLVIDGVTVTTDSTTIFLRLIIDGLEESGDLYQWAIYGFSSGTAGTPDFNNEIRLTDVGANLGVGNAASDSFSATVTVFDPGGSLHKIGTISHCSYMDGAGNLQGVEGGAFSLDISGTVTGAILYGSSNITAGSMVALGVA